MIDPQKTLNLEMEKLKTESHSYEDYIIFIGQLSKTRHYSPHGPVIKDNSAHRLELMMHHH